MLRCCRLNLFELRLGNCASSLRFSGLILMFAGFVAVAICPDAFGQESESGPVTISVEWEDDLGPEGLMTAYKSQDQALNKKKVLAEQKQMRDRLVGFGVIGGAFLALMGILFAYLRLDHATRGFHSGRLQLLASFISILMLATCYFLWTQVLFK